MSQVLAEHLQKNTLLKDFPLSGLELLAGIAHRKFLRAGQTLFTEGKPSEALYLLVEGRVSFTMHAEDGRLAKLNALSDGESLGQSSLLDGATLHMCTATAEVDSLFIEIMATDFETLSKEKPRLGLTLRQCISTDLERKLLNAAPALKSIFIRALAS